MTAFDHQAAKAARSASPATPDALATADALAPRDLGQTLLGPLYAEFFQRLHVSLQPHEPGVKRLFVARAGIRLHQLYLLWCEARGITPAESEVLWASRLLATKALYGLDDDLFHVMMQKEYPNRSIGVVAKSLSRFGEPLTLGPQRKQPSTKLRRLLESGKLPAMDAFLTAEAEAARAYLHGVTDGAERVVLVDSGWHGTVHLLLDSLLKAEVGSLFIARVLRSGEPSPPRSEMVGLLLETDEFSPDLPESALTFHRHLIEAPLEPPTPSIERVVVGADGTASAPEALGSEAVDEDDPSDQIFLGIGDHLRALGGKPVHRIQTDYVRASRDLAGRILYPSLDDVATLDLGLRSSDFGKEHSAPILMPPEPRTEHDRPESRISESLWPQGQAVLEYGSLGALPVHRALSQDLSPEQYFHPWSTDDNGSGATVAVVTRTKDRPVLLRRAAESVASQTHTDYRWVVVNDGGNLSLVEDVIRRSAVRRSSITVVSNFTSVGMEAASNLGVRTVQSDLVTIHDDDDSWSPWFLERTTDFLLADAGYHGVVTHATYVSEEVINDEVVIRDQRPHTPSLESINLAELSGTNLFAPIAFVFRRSVYDELGGYAEHLPVLGDWDFNLRVLTRGDIAVLPEPLAYYHHRDVGASITYGNSVIAGRSKHLEFDARVRNAMYRGIAEGSALGQLSLTGYAIKTLREEMRRTASAPRSRGGSAPAAAGLDVDTLWLAFVASLQRSEDHESRPAWRERFSTKNVASTSSAPSVPSWRLAKQMARELDPNDVPPAPDFDEAAYLEANPDVREAVEDPAHELRSGWAHYVRSGRRERRERPTRKRGRS